MIVTESGARSQEVGPHGSCAGVVPPDAAATGAALGRPEHLLELSWSKPTRRGR
jgi:hypothetical protein